MSENLTQSPHSSQEKSSVPPPHVEDLRGRMFSRLTVIGFYGKTRHYAQLWECQCICGKTVVVRRDCLISGNTKSCGCYSVERLRELATKHGCGGRSNRTSEYNIWAVMLQRCLNQKNPKWADYGGRGITVCSRWRAFENFLADMGQKLSPKHEIERLDNNKGYEPGNCVWATRKEQTRNTRRTRLLTFNGTTLCIVDWAKQLSLHISTIHRRLRLGWSVERTLTEPQMNRSQAARHAALIQQRRKREARR